MAVQQNKSKEELISELEKLQQDYNSLKEASDTGMPESKNTKEYLKKEQAYFLQIFAAAPVGLLLLDKDFSITQVNKTGAKVLLRDSAKLIGKLVGSGLECVHSFESSKNCGFGLYCTECPLRQGFESVLASGQSVHGAEINITTRIGGNAGERWLKVDAEPIEIDGKQLVIIAIDDITDRKQAETAQRESQEKYRMIFEYSPLGLLSFNEKGVIVACNDSFVRIIGSTREALVGLNMHNLPDNKMVSAIQQALNGSTGSYEGIYHSITSDRISPVRALFTPIDVGDGHIHGGVGIIEDITLRRQTEEELEENREKYRGLSDAAFEAIFFFEKGICIEQNQMAEKMFGYTPEEAVGMTGTEWIAVEYREMVMKNLLTGYEEPYEAVAIKKDGTTFPCTLHGKMMHYKGRDISVTSFRDITEGKRAEQALRESEEKFRTVADFAYDWEYWEGKDGQIIYISPSCKRISGYEPEAFLSDNLLLEKIVHPADTKLIKVHIGKVHSIEHMHEIEELDYRIIRKDGTVAHISHLCRPVFDEKGNYLGRRISNRDINERKKAEETLHNERSLLRTLIDNIPDFIYTKDMNGRKTLANLTEVRFTGAKSEAEVLGKDDFAFFPKEMAEKFLADDLSVLKTGQPILNKEGYVFDKNGGKRWLLSSKLPLRDKENKIIGLIGIGHDISDRKQVEEALRESETRFRNIADTAPVFIWMTGTDGLCNYFNKPWLDFTGRTPDQEMGTGWMEGVHHDDYQSCLDTFSEAFNMQSKYKMVYRLRCADGEYRWLLENGVPRFTPDGTFDGYMGSCMDITENKHAEALQREALDRLEKIAGRVPGVVYQFKLSPDGRSCLPYASEGISKIFRVSPEEVREDASRVFANLHPDDYKGVITSIMASAQNLVPWKYEFRVKFNDGTVRWLSSNAMPQPEPDGSILWHGFIDDITERKQTQQILLESEERYKIITQNTLDIIFMLDKTGRQLFFNESAEKILGYKLEDIIGKSFTRFVPKSELPKYFLQLKNVFLNKEITNFITKLYHENGELIDVEINGKLVRYEGKLVALGTMRNISERRKAELIINQQNLELIKANAEKDKFFSIIAHDLRGPIGGFMGLTERMDEGMKGLTLDQLQEMVGVMKKSASSLYSLLENLLEWSRMQRGLITFHPFSFPLLPKIIEIRQTVMDAASKKEISISQSIPNDMVVFADENMLASIIRNLLGNAVKFTPNGGKISVSARTKSKDFVEISIKDTGIGMNQYMTNNLFSLDVNTSRKGTKGESSTGLGLIICKDFIEKNGGKLLIESREGKGSTFRFTIPVSTEPQVKTKSDTAIPGSIAKSQFKRLNVLIAEDDETSEMLISAALESVCKEVFKVSTGYQAVKACRENPDIDLVLMDIKMPVMDGLEATRQIRQFNNDVIIIAQTAYGLSGDKELAIKSGCNDYIAKPLDIAVLKGMIQKYF